MGQADDGDVLHRVVGEQRGLHLAAIHVLAAADHHVLLAIDHVVEALGRAIAEVARVEPAVGEGLGRRVRAVPVAGDDVRPAHPELADAAAFDITSLVVDDAHCGHRHGAPDAVGMGEVVRAAIADHRRGRLGEAVAVARRNAGLELAADAVDQVGWHRRAAGADAAEAREVHAARRCALQQRTHHRRYAGQAGDALALDQVDGDIRIPLEHQHQLRAHGAADVEARQATDVEEREGLQ